MKKVIINCLLIICLLISTSVVFALEVCPECQQVSYNADTGICDYGCRVQTKYDMTTALGNTQVTFNSPRSDYYVISVPAQLSPGQIGDVNIEGQWESDRLIKIFTDETVRLTNNLNSNDECYLDVYFYGVRERGDNMQPYSSQQQIGVEKANGKMLFGTWTGVIDYWVEFEDCTNPRLADFAIDNGYVYLYVTDDMTEEEYKDRILKVILINAYGVDGINYTVVDCLNLLTQELTEDPDTTWVEAKVNGLIDDIDLREFGYPPYGGLVCNTGWEVSRLSTDKTPVTMPEPLSTLENKPVVNCSSLFNNFKNLQTAPTLPLYTIDMSFMFNGCESLREMPIIPASVEDMNSAFSGCTQLIRTTALPAGVQDLSSVFWGCSSLEAVPDIPVGVTDISYAFVDCISLQSAPSIPSSVKEMSDTFKNCTSLTGIIEINANPHTYGDCFAGVNFATQNITLTGASLYLDDMGRTGLNYCDVCNGTCFQNHA